MWKIILLLGFSTDPRLRIFIPCQVVADTDVFKISYDKQRFFGLLKFLRAELPRSDREFQRFCCFFNDFTDIKKSQIGAQLLNIYVDGFRYTPVRCSRAKKAVHNVLTNLDFMLLTRAKFHQEGLRQKQHVRKSKHFEASSVLAPVLRQMGSWPSVDAVVRELFGVGAAELYGLVDRWHAAFLQEKFQSGSSPEATPHATPDNAPKHPVEEVPPRCDFDYWRHHREWSCRVFDMINAQRGEAAPLVYDRATSGGFLCVERFMAIPGRSGERPA